MSWMSCDMIGQDSWMVVGEHTQSKAEQLEILCIVTKDDIVIDI